MDIEVGQEVAEGLQVVSLLGEGGQCKLYEAVEKAEGKKPRRVVVKVPKNSSRTSLKALENEARVLKELNTPLAPRLIAAKLDNSPPFIAIELIRGQALSEPPRPTSAKSVLDITLDLLDAIGQVHSSGFVHRDIKPQNFIVGLRNSLVDFSLAARAGERGIPGGTRRYSVEECMRGEARAECDLYSAGRVLSELASHSRHKGLAKVAEAAVNWMFSSATEMASAARWAAHDLSAPRVVLGYRRVEIRESCRIGRAHGLEMQIPDRERFVSPVHAVIKLEGDSFILEDAGSLNGTFVFRGGYRKVREPIELEDGDLIALCYSRRKGAHVVLRFWRW